MKNVKKYLVVALCLLMTLALFAACQPTQTTEATPTPGGGTQPSGSDFFTDLPEQIVMKRGDEYRVFLWANQEENEWVNGDEAARDHAKDLKTQWEEFQKQFGVTVTWIPCSNQAGWLEEMLAPAAAGEPTADIVHMGGPFAIPYSLTYGAAPLGTYFADLNEYSQYADFKKTDYWNTDGAANMGTFNGKLYAVFPQQIGYDAIATNQVCFFNKEILAKNGYEDTAIYDMFNKGEWTFDKFKAIAAACTDADNDVFGTCIGQNAMSMLSLISANNGNLLAADASGVQQFAADSTASLNAINFFIDMCKNDKSVLTENYSSQDEAQLFKSGKVALLLTYMNRVSSGASKRNTAMYQMEKLKYGIILPPKGPDATDYRSENNWSTPYGVMKGHSNMAGVVQCLSIYMRPFVKPDSVEAAEMLGTDLTKYCKDDQSIEVLKSASSKTCYPAFMAYWTLQANDGPSLSGVVGSGLRKWVEGESTPERDFAANKDALNTAISDLIAGK